MFGELTRDDVFRIETRRLWLRWPRASDAAAIAAFASRPEVALMTGSVPHPYPPGEAEGYVARARAANAAGASLNMAITEKNRARALVGTMGLDDQAPGKVHLGYMLAPGFWGMGYACEAAQAIIDVAFLLSETPEIEASVTAGNAGSIRVLEKCGFLALGGAIQEVLARGGMVHLERFALSRPQWRRSLLMTRSRQRETCTA